MSEIPHWTALLAGIELEDVLILNDAVMSFIERSDTSVAITSQSGLA